MFSCFFIRISSVDTQLLFLDYYTNTRMKYHVLVEDLHAPRNTTKVENSLLELST